ncbi:MAG: hypothetical protein ACE361_19145 [Aureliella sp.]
MGIAHEDAIMHLGVSREGGLKVNVLENRLADFFTSHLGGIRLPA